MMNGRAEIVILEDNPSDVELLREALRESDVQHELLPYEDGDEVIEALRQSADSARLPDLVLLDLNVPKTEGLDALAAIRAIPELCGVPVVILTSSGFTQDRVSAAMCGANSYIQKPVTFDGYVAHVAPAIKEILRGPK